MRARRLLLYLILAGLMARVLYLGQVASLPFFHDPVGDSARYLDRAREILGGRFLADRPFFYGGILYPWLLALDLLIFGTNLYPVCLLQAIGGCVLAWVIYRLAQAAVGRGAARSRRTIALLAAGMALFYGPFAFLEADILMISWTILLMMVGALLLLEGIHQTTRGAMLARLTGAGLLLGIAATERPNLLLLLPATSVWALVFAPTARRAAGIAVMAAGSAVLLAVSGLNYASSGKWVLLTTSSGINFYIGNNESARGTFDEPWARSDPEFAASHFDLEESSLTMARRLSGRELDAVGASRFWMSEGLEFLRSHRLGSARLYLRKVMLFWSAEEVPNHLNFDFMRSVAPALWLMPLTFGLVAPLGLYGFVTASARRFVSRPALVLLCLLVVVPMSTVIPFFVADRYRVPVVPPLMVAGACGLLSIWRMLAVRLTRRRACLHLACVLLAGLAMAAPLRQDDTSRDYWMMARAYMKQEEPMLAAANYQRAIAISPDDPLLHNGLGVVYQRIGQPDRAEDEYRTAVRLSPGLVLPRKNLGLILMRHGAARADQAYENLVIAEKAEPDSVEVARAMAALLMYRGDAAGAGERAQKVLRMAPGDPAARAILDATKAPPAAPR